MAVVVTSVSLLTTSTFVGFSMWVVPKPATKIIMALVCSLDIFWSLDCLSSLSLLLVNIDALFHSVLAYVRVMMKPLLASIQHLFVIYSIHRYSMITGKVAYFAKPCGVLTSSVLTILIVYLSKVGPVLDIFLANNESYLAYVREIWAVHAALEFLSVICFTSVHMFVLCSIAKKSQQYFLILHTWSSILICF